MYFIYIIRCQGGTLYTGITSDLGRRMSEHFGQTEKCAKYTRSHKAEAIEAVWNTENRSLASRLEWSIKQLTRPKKLRLISGELDLADVLGGEEAAEYSRLNNAELSLPPCGD